MIWSSTGPEAPRRAPRLRRAAPRFNQPIGPLWRCAPQFRGQKSTAPSWSTAQSISSAVTTSGGASRMVAPWVSLTNTPRSSSRSLSSTSGAERGIDVDPGPETDAADGRHAVPDQTHRAVRGAAHPARRTAPGTPRSRAAGPRTCPPPRPAGCRRRSSRADRDAGRRARRRCRPPPRPARHRRRAPCPAGRGRARRRRGHSRRYVPVRPSPDWISSQISSTRRSVQSSRSLGR